MRRIQIYWFEQLTAADNEVVGKKCANLGEITRLGLPVPKGFAIPAYVEEDFMRMSGAFDQIVELCETTVHKDNLKNPSCQMELSNKIRKIVEEKEIPMEIEENIVKHYLELCRRLGKEDLPVSVRSAGVKSYPGMYETYLNVRGKEELLRRIKNVWSSIFNTRTIATLVQMGRPIYESPSIGVGVLEMVNARCSGVTFTVDPLTGDIEKAVVEANYGLGEGVVSGRVSVDMYVVDKKKLTVLEKRLGEKATMVVYGKEGVVEQKVPEEMRNNFAADEKEIIEVVKLSLKLENHFGEPQDVEWAVHRDKTFPDNVYLLQCRPIVGVTIGKVKNAVSEAADVLLKWI